MNDSSEKENPANRNNGDVSETIPVLFDENSLDQRQPSKPEENNGNVSETETAASENSFYSSAEERDEQSKPGMRYLKLRKIYPFLGNFEKELRKLVPNQKTDGENEVMDKMKTMMREKEHAKAVEFLGNPNLIDIYKIMKSLEEFSKTHHILKDVFNDTAPKDFDFITTAALSQKKRLIVDDFANPYETETCEYKYYWYPLGEKQKDSLKKVMCSFLNHKGGRIYLGITDYGEIKGISLTKKEVEGLTNQITELRKMINPNSDQLDIKCFFIPVDKNNNDVIAGRFVVKIVVVPKDLERYYWYGKIFVPIRFQDRTVYYSGAPPINREKMKSDESLNVSKNDLQKRELDVDRFDPDIDTPIKNCIKVIIAIKKQLSERDFEIVIKKLDYLKGKEDSGKLFEFYSKMGFLYRKFTDETRARDYIEAMIKLSENLYGHLKYALCDIYIQH